MRAGRYPCIEFLPLLLAFVVAASAQASSENVTANISIGKFGQMPVAFTENQGQWDERVKFRASAAGAAIWFTSDGIYYQFTRRIRKDDFTPDDPLQMLHKRFDQEPGTIEQLVIRASFAGANPGAEVVGEGLMEYQCNYFIGNDPSKWHTEIPNFSSILYKGVYPGIDIRFFGSEGGKAGYEFIATPGADLAQIEIEYQGIDELWVDADGRLVARTDWGDMIAAIGSAASGTSLTSRGLMLISEHTAGFDVAVNETRQSASLSLNLDYSTYLGGSSNEFGWSVAVDDSGAAYVAGATGSIDFPTVNPYQGILQESSDAFVTKLSSAGNSLIYSTYLGGSDTEGGGQWGPSVAVDGSGAAYVAGTTVSTDFPTVNPYQTHQGYDDAFVTKLSSTGSSLVYSTYLGGSMADQLAGIAVDFSGAAHVTGKTVSTDFPTVNHYQTHQGPWDAFVTKFSSSGSSLVYSTYLGGGISDHGQGIAVDGYGYAYVTGLTESSNFPTRSPYQGTFQGVLDGFVTKFSGSGSLVYSTFLGGSGYDMSFSVDVFWDHYGDPPGYVAVAVGLTESSDFPTVNPYQTYQGSRDVFVTRLDNSGSGVVYSTYLGGSGSDEAYGVAVRGSGEAHVTGLTYSTDFPTVNPYQTDQGYVDAFVTKLSSSGNSLVYSTYLGGSSADVARGIALDPYGSAYVAGETYSTNFPTINPYQTDQGNHDAFVSKLSIAVFVPGDADGSGTVDIDDVVYLISYIFSGGPGPVPDESGDADCSSAVDIDDVVYVIAYIFSGGPPPGDPDSDGVPDC